MASSSQTSSQSIAADEVFQMVRAHQKKVARLPPIVEAKTILIHSTSGLLYSQKHAEACGYPSGSMVNFACDDNGCPILSVSSLANETKDLLANPQRSLLIGKDREDNKNLVITLRGDVVSVPGNERDVVRTTYLARHPNANWVDFDDFVFLRIEPKVVSFLFPDATNCPFDDDISSQLEEFTINELREEFTNNELKEAKVDPIYQFSKPIRSHMNKDHANDTKLMVQHSTSVPVDFAYMLDVDSLGFNVKAGYQDKNFTLRVAFPRRAEERKDVKKIIIEMLQAAKSQVG